MYEHKCRDKEEADQNVNRNANTSNSKQIDKVEWKSATKDQRDDELWASFPAAPSCLPPFSCAARPYRRGRTRRMQVLCFLCSLALLFIFGRLCLCMRVNCNSAYCNENVASCKKKVRMCFRSSLLTAVTWKPYWHKPEAHAGLHARYIYTLCLTGRQIIPAEHQHPGQSSRGLDQGTCELVWGRKGFKWKQEKKKHEEMRWLPPPLPPPPPFTSQVFENLAKERIVFLRNAVWTHLNQLSQQCVTNDEVGAPQYRQKSTEAPTTPPPPMLCSYTRRWGSRWSAATSRETSNTS